MPGAEAHVQHDERAQLQPPPRELQLPGLGRRALLPPQQPLPRGGLGHDERAFVQQRGRHGPCGTLRAPPARQRRALLHGQLHRLLGGGLPAPRELRARLAAARRRRRHGAALGLLQLGLGVGTLRLGRLEHRRFLHQAAAFVALQPHGQPAVVQPVHAFPRPVLPAPEQPQRRRAARHPAVSLPVSKHVRQKGIRLLFQRHGLLLHAFSGQRLLLPPTSDIPGHQAVRYVIRGGKATSWGPQGLTRAPSPPRTRSAEGGLSRLALSVRRCQPPRGAAGRLGPLCAAGDRRVRALGLRLPLR